MLDPVLKEHVGPAALEGGMKYIFSPNPSCNMCGSTRRRQIGLRLNRSQGLHPKRAGGIAVSIQRCADCGLHYPDPMPMPESLDDHYGIPPEDYWYAEVHSWDEAHFRREIGIAKRLLDFRPGMKALDIGSGLGKSLKALTNAGFDAFGIEPSGPFRDRSITHMGADPAKVVLSPIEDATFPDGTFDLITFGAVLEHLYDPSAVLERVLPWLRPGGLIQAEVPSSNHFLAKFLNAYFALRGTNLVTNTSPMHVPFHIHEFTIESFRRNGRRIGYEVAEHSYMVSYIAFAPKFLHPLLHAYMDRTETGMQLEVWLRPSGDAASSSLS